MASWRQSKFLITLTVAFAVFVDIFLYGIVIPILPPIFINRAHVAEEDVQYWVSVGFVIYNVATILTCPVFGWIADRWQNRKIPLLGGLVLLAASNVLFAFGTTIPALMAARTFQSISASIVWAVGLALLVDSVEGNEIGVSMGWITLTISVALSSGPAFGGIIYEQLGHNATFAITTGIIVIDIILRLIIVDRKSLKPPSVEAESSRSPSVTENPRENRVSSNNESENTPLIGTPKQKSTIMILITDKGLVSASILVFLASLVQQGLETVLAIYLEENFGWSTQDAGLVFLALMAPCLSGPIIGALSNRIGGLVMSLWGFAILGVSHCLLSLIKNDHTGSIVALVAILFGVGTGVATVLTIQMAAITSFADRKEKEIPGIFGPAGATAQCCSVYNTVFATAGIAGPALAGLLQIKFDWTVTTVSLGLLALLGCVTILVAHYDTIISGAKVKAKFSGNDSDGYTDE